MARNQQGIAVPAPREQRVALEKNLGAVASPASSQVANEYDSLIEGLSSLNPALQHYADKAHKENTEAALAAGAGAAAKEQDPRFVGDAEPAQPPNVPVAMRPEFIKAFRKGIADRTGILEGNAILDAYSEQSRLPDFNPTAFFAEQRAKALAGHSDPAMIAHIGGHIDKAQETALGDYRRLQQTRLGEQRNGILGAKLSEVSPWAGSESAARVLADASDAHAASGGTRPEAVALALQHFEGLSDRFGGSPELFDAFHMKDPKTGLSYVEMNPALSDAVAKAQARATRLSNETLFKQGLATRTTLVADLERSLDAGDWDGLTDDQTRERLLPHVGEQGIFNTDKELAAFENRVRDRQVKVRARTGELAAFRSGSAWSLSEDAQRRNITELTAPYVQSLITGGEGAAQAIPAILNAHSAGRTSVGNPTLKAWVASLEQQVPEKGAAAPPQFVLASQLYTQLKGSGNPRLIGEYFNENTQAMMESYTRNTAFNSIDSPTAYEMAYEVVNPETRKRAAEMVKDPSAKAAFKSSARSGAVSWVRRMAPSWKWLALDPDTSSLEFAAVEEAQRVKTERPWMDQSQIEEHLDRWSSNNSFRDSTTNAMIELPQAFNDAPTQQAFSDYLGMVKQAWGNEAVPRVKHRANGHYVLQVELNGGVHTLSTDLDVRDLQKLHSAKHSLGNEERTSLATVRSKLLNGTATSQDVTDNADVIYKAKELKAWDSQLESKAQTLRAEAMKTRFESKLSESISVATKRAEFNPAAAARKIEPTSAAVAKQLAAKGGHAAALIAVSEGLRLQAYDDSGGRTIGFGYHFNGQTPEQIADDFRRASIPPEQVEAIKAGRFAITQEQATRLLEVTVPRYEGYAKAAVEKREAGAWEKLPSHQRAVLTDMAYQLGPQKLDQFDKGLSALLKGDASGSNLEVMIGKGKDRKVDSRRHTIRTVMLAGATPFQTILDHAAAKPATPVQLRASLAAAGS